VVTPVLPVKQVLLDQEVLVVTQVLKEIPAQQAQLVQKVHKVMAEPRVIPETPVLLDKQAEPVKPVKQVLKAILAILVILAELAEPARLAKQVQEVQLGL
jgi:hypothetical protein